MSANDTQASIIERTGYRIANVVERWMPSPFLFAILLTYFVYIAALVLGQLGMIEQPGGGAAGPFELVELWYGGFWNFLAFECKWLNRIVEMKFGAIVIEFGCRVIERFPKLAY